MHSSLLITIVIIVLALAFDFINGFHDTATVVATSISTRALSPKVAIGLCAIFNFLGAFISTAVAKTVGAGIVDDKLIPLWVIAAVLVAAITWDLLTWYFAIPSSSSYALIGALVGGAIAFSQSFNIVNWGNLFDEVILWLFLSPIIGLIVGYIFMAILNKLVGSAKPRKVNKFFQRLQIISAIFMALNHGENDSQKSMGIITMALISGGFLGAFNVPLWVIFLCATAMGLGTALGGKRIIKTMGNGVTKLNPVSGFAAQSAAGAIIAMATAFKAPVSTTQIITTSIMGAGAERSIKRVKWGVAKTIAWAWVLTIPGAALLAFIYVEIVKIFV